MVDNGEKGVKEEKEAKEDTAVKEENNLYIKRVV
jgi:hypothetical protein